MSCMRADFSLVAVLEFHWQRSTQLQCNTLNFMYDPIRHDAIIDFTAYIYTLIAEDVRVENPHDSLAVHRVATPGAASNFDVSLDVHRQIGNHAARAFVYIPVVAHDLSSGAGIQQ